MGTHRILDFAICSPSMVPWIDTIGVDQGFDVSPHRAVRIKFKASPSNYLIRCIKKPKAFPRERPIGCARQPVVAEWQCARTAVETDGSLRGYAGAPLSPAPPGELWPSLVHAMETEMSRQHDKVDAHGRASHTHAGRARGADTNFSLALPKRAIPSLGKVALTAHALKWLSVRVRALAHFARNIQRGHAISPSAVLQWTANLEEGHGRKLLARDATGHRARVERQP